MLDFNFWFNTALIIILTPWKNIFVFITGPTQFVVAWKRQCNSVVSFSFCTYSDTWYSKQNMWLLAEVLLFAVSLKRRSNLISFPPLILRSTTLKSVDFVLTIGHLRVCDFLRYLTSPCRVCYSRLNSKYSL